MSSSSLLLHGFVAFSSFSFIEHSVLVSLLLLLLLLLFFLLPYVYMCKRTGFYFIPDFHSHNSFFFPFVQCQSLTQTPTQCVWSPGQGHSKSLQSPMGNTFQFHSPVNDDHEDDEGEINHVRCLVEWLWFRRLSGLVINRFISSSSLRARSQTLNFPRRTTHYALNFVFNQPMDT